jgi:hypothetical protein
MVDSHSGERTGRETSTSAVGAARQNYRYLGSKDQSRTFSASDVDERLVEDVADVEAGNDENIRIAGDVGQNALCPCYAQQDGGSWPDHRGDRGRPSGVRQRNLEQISTRKATLGANRTLGNQLSFLVSCAPRFPNNLAVSKFDRVGSSDLGIEFPRCEAICIRRRIFLQIAYSFERGRVGVLVSAHIAL